jgi:hypothetical protein
VTFHLYFCVIMPCLGYSHHNAADSLPCVIMHFCIITLPLGYSHYNAAAFPPLCSCYNATIRSVSCFIISSARNISPVSPHYNAATSPPVCSHYNATIRSVSCPTTSPACDIPCFCIIMPLLGYSHYNTADSPPFAWVIMPHLLVYLHYNVSRSWPPPWISA